MENESMTAEQLLQNESMTAEQLLQSEDLLMIKKIADKYRLSVQELGRIISRKNGKYYRLQILLNKDEIDLIDKNAKRLKLSRSKYCTLCYKKALRENLYDNIDILKVVGESESGKKREHRAVISFDMPSDYLEMKKLADDLGIPFSSLVRYFALNIKL